MPRVAAGTRIAAGTRVTAGTRIAAGARNPAQSPYLVKLFAYNRFTSGAAQGSTGSPSCSNKIVSDASRKAKTDASLLLDPMAGISSVAQWEMIEGFAPVGGIPTYDWTVLDLAIQEVAGYVNKQAMLRVVGGSMNGTPNCYIGGGTGALNVAAPEGTATQIHLLVRNDYRPPSNGAQISITVTPGVNTITSGQESFTVNGVPTNLGAGPALNGAPTTIYLITLSGPVTLIHPINTQVEYTVNPAVYATATSYLIGDMIFAPPATTLNNEGLDNRVYCVVNAFTSTAFLTDLASGNLGQVLVWADGSATTIACPWDSVILARRTAMIQAMGVRFGTNPFVYAISMAWAGRIGEMTLGDGQTAQQVAAAFFAAGYTDTRYANAWKQGIDVYAAAFPAPMRLSLCLQEPFFPTLVMPTAISLAGTSSNSVNRQRILMGNTAGLAVGMVVNGPGVVNAFIGSINANVSVDMLVSSNPTWPGGGAVPAYNATDNGANGNAGAGTFVFNGLNKTVTGTGDNGLPSIIALSTGTVSAVNVGQSVTGAGVPAGALVGSIIDSTHFMLSDRRTRQNGTLQFAGAGVTLTLTNDGQTYQSPNVLIREIAGRNSGGTVAGPRGDTYIRSANATNHETGYIGSAYPGRVMIQYNGLAVGNFGFPGGSFRSMVAGSNEFNPNPPTQEASLAARAGGYQSVGGANPLPTITTFFQILTDDACSYFEIYANDADAVNPAQMLKVSLRQDQ